MTVTVADAAAFECEMKRRVALDGCGGHGFQIPIACTSEGAPLTKADRRIVCEMQKLALGLSPFSYVICGEVLERRETMKWKVQSPAINEATHWRQIMLYYPREDRDFFRKIVVPLTLGEKRKVEATRYGWGSPGVACAFPGGCD